MSGVSSLQSVISLVCYFSGVISPVLFLRCIVVPGCCCSGVLLLRGVIAPVYYFSGVLLLCIAVSPEYHCLNII